MINNNRQTSRCREKKGKGKLCLHVSLPVAQITGGCNVRPRYAIRRKLQSGLRLEVRHAVQGPQRSDNAEADPTYTELTHLHGYAAQICEI